MSREKGAVIARNFLFPSLRKDEEEGEKSEEETEISGNDLFVSLKSEERKEKVFYIMKIVLKEAIKCTFSLMNKKDKQSGIKIPPNQIPPNLLQEKQVPTSSNESTKRTREEKTSAKSSKPQPKKPKVGADLNPTQARDTRVVEENRSFVEIAFEMPNIFKPKPPPPDCTFSAFNYFHCRFVTPIANRKAIDLRAQAEREAYRHLDDNLATFIICYMLPYYTEMPPAAKQFAKHCSVHLRNQLRRDPRLLPEQIDALVAKFCNILTEYYTSHIVRPAADRQLRP
uniref:Uncharacterized protein n=1 Tax=Romanomermis culicivorax TaxID=13658 RepID=A0A915IHP8_ROMCU